MSGTDRTLNEGQPLCGLPLELRWESETNPLPLRAVQVPPQGKRRTLGLEAPPWLWTGPTDQPFDFCLHVRRLCQDMVRLCPELAHVDVSRLLFGITQARNSTRGGLQARISPLRFRHGALVEQRDDVLFRIQRYYVDNAEMLYLVTFCLPRFLDRPFDDKFITLFHELYHISPAFDGDFRRHGRRGHLHTHSKKEFDEHMAHLARAYLANGATPELHHFLRLDFAQLEHRHGRVLGVAVPRPKLIPIRLHKSKTRESRTSGKVAHG